MMKISIRMKNVVDVLVVLREVFLKEHLITVRLIRKVWNKYRFNRRFSATAWHASYTLIGSLYVWIVNIMRILRLFRFSLATLGVKIPHCITGTYYMTTSIFYTVIALELFQATR